MRDFFNTKQCLRTNQRHFGGKTLQSSSFIYEFLRKQVNQMLEVLSFCDRERAQHRSIKITVVTFLVKKK